MKKALKRSLAIVLAILMILGSGIAASAAPMKPQALREDAAFAPAAVNPAGSLAITKQPTDSSFRMYYEEPDLSGMEVSVLGGIFTAPTTIVYDDVANDYKVGPNKILWDIWVNPADWRYGWKEGSNATILFVYAYQCTDFHVEKIVGGVEYGYYDKELVFYAQAPITVIATSSQNDMSSAKVLTLDVPETVTVKAYNSVWLKFTATQDGYYRFRSDGGSYGETLYSREGEILEIPSLDPYAELYDADGDWLDYDDDGGGNLNFRLFRQMSQGETVYLRAALYHEERSASYTVTVSRVGSEQPTLQLKSYEITNYYRDVIDIDALLEGTGFDYYDVYLFYDYEQFRDDCNGFFSMQTGVGYITILAPDGSMAEVKVTVKYSTAQWLCIIFLGGFVWMKFTRPGVPFNLWDNIYDFLFVYGVRNGLFELFVYEWGLPSNWFSWLLR